MIGAVLVTLMLAQSQIPQQSDPPYVSASPTRPGEAQRPFAGRMPSDPASLVQMQAFGRCVARHAPTKAAALLRMNFTEPQFGSAVRKLAWSDNGCVPRGKRAQFAPELFAGAMAEELLSHTTNMASALTYDPSRPPVKAMNDSDLVASCVARTSPRDVAALFATPPASAAEATAIRGLTPVVERCVADGRQARFNKPGLRAILATAFFRIVQSGTSA
ncbi:hypothetical protein [Sphingomonas aerophila]|uniref:Uncharacterized protein n=1 Tax=Sphingomonas aerophila TaxID=1344948 RepID=A0A7W9ESW1_9SPHN|nr:hypothetical protein [Sphingomonas aerophila]MBB5713555.1 hypothetical protein [Sphingomonas aerophila]